MGDELDSILRERAPPVWMPCWWITRRQGCPGSFPVLLIEPLGFWVGRRRAPIVLVLVLVLVVVIVSFCRRPRSRARRRGRTRLRAKTRQLLDRPRRRRPPRSAGGQGIELEDDDEEDDGGMSSGKRCKNRARSHPNGSANRRRAYERKTTVRNSASLCRRLDGLLSLVRCESTDSYPGDPQNGRDKFDWLLNSGRPSTRSGQLSWRRGQAGELPAQGPHRDRMSNLIISY